MSTKPTLRPDWDTNQTHTTAPLAGHVTDGWASSEIPASDELNEWMRRAGLWTKWLDDGDLAFAGLVMSTKQVAIANASQNDLDLGTAGAIAGTLVVQLTGGGASAVITGIARDSAEEGRLLVLANVTGSVVGLTIGSGASAAANRIDNSPLPSGAVIQIPHQGVVALRYTDPPTGRWSLLWSNFPIGTVTDTLTIAAASAREFSTTTHTFNVGFWTTGAGTNPIVYPVEVPEGWTITTWSIYANKASNGASTIHAELDKIDGTTGTASAVGATSANSTNAPGFITLGVGSLTEVTATGFSYYVKFVPDSGVAGDKSYGVRVTCTHKIGYV